VGKYRQTLINVLGTAWLQCCGGVWSLSSSWPRCYSTERTTSPISSKRRGSAIPSRGRCRRRT